MVMSNVSVASTSMVIFAGGSAFRCSSPSSPRFFLLLFLRFVEDRDVEGSLNDIWSASLSRGPIWIKGFAEEYFWSLFLFVVFDRIENFLFFTFSRSIR